MEKLVRRIVLKLDGGVSLSQDQREVVEYALYNVFITCGTVVGVLLAGWLLGVMPEAVTALMTGAAFRWSAGGAHLSTPYRCMAVSILLPSLAAVVSKEVGELHALEVTRAVAALVAVLAVVSAVVIRAYAPADTENRRIPAGRRARFRAFAYATLLVWLGVVWLLWRQDELSLVSASCAGLAWQMTTVTPVGCQVLSGIDSVLAASERRLRRRQ